MAEDLTGAGGPTYTYRSTMRAAGTSTRVDLPDWARKFTVNFRQSDGTSADSGRLATSGTDDTAIGNNVFPCPSGAALEISVGPISSGTRSLYLTGDTATGYAHIVLE